MSNLSFHLSNLTFDLNMTSSDGLPVSGGPRAELGASVEGPALCGGRCPSCESDLDSDPTQQAAPKETQGRMCKALTLVFQRTGFLK